MSGQQTDQPDWNAIAQTDPTVEVMQRQNVPLTRENYIEMKYGSPGGDDHPEEWTEEHEASLPAPFQRG